MNNDATLKQLTDLIMQQAEEKKWGTDPSEVNVGEKIALIHSEISEIFEAYRKGEIHGIDGMDGEIASALIRIFHLAGIMKFDLTPLVLQKIERNKGRDWDWDKLKEEKNG